MLYAIYLLSVPQKVGDVISLYRIFLHLRPRGSSGTTMPRPLLNLCVKVKKVKVL